MVVLRVREEGRRERGREGGWGEGKRVEEIRVSSSHQLHTYISSFSRNDFPHV